MRIVAICALAVAALSRLAMAQDIARPAVATVPNCVVPNCVVTVMEQADLPPQEIGVIQDIPVKAGQKVEKGQLLMQLDDRKAVAEQDVAEAKYKAALAKANDDINIRYAKAAAAVAKAEYEVNVKANAVVPGSVPQVRLSELYLKCKETELAIEKADLDRRVAIEEANVGKAEVEAAKVTVDRHKLLAPIAGVVMPLRAHKGEAVQPSQAVLRVVNLDTLWVESREVHATKYARSEIDKQNVTVDFVITRDEKRSLPGKIVFVSPETDSGDTYMVRAQVDNVKLSNDSWLLYPGMQAEMNIQLDKYH